MTESSTLTPPSGAISLEATAGWWVRGGGPVDLANLFAHIGTAESSNQPGAIQQGQPYATTGWGEWQITPGDSYPTIGVDYELLAPLVNARAAVAKYKSQGVEAWEGDPVAAAYLATGVQPTPIVSPVTPGETPGEYVPIGTAPAGTHNLWTPPVPKPVEEGVMIVGIVEYANALWGVFATAGQVKKRHLSANTVDALVALGAKRLSGAPWTAALVASLPVVP